MARGSQVFNVAAGSDLHSAITAYERSLSNRLLAVPFPTFLPRRNGPPMVPLGESTVKNVSEVTVISRVVENLKRQVARISPDLADLIELQKPIVYAVAAAFKASITTGNKSFSPSPTAGTLGVAPLFPYAIKPTSGTPSGYILNSFRLSLTADSDVYILGSSTNFYKGQTTSGSTTWYYIFAGGLVEIGSTPSLEQIQIISKEKQDISPYIPGTFTDIPTNFNYPAYVYQIPGFYIDNQSDGIKVVARARATKTAEIRPVGVVFYEYDFFKALINAA